MMKRNVFICGLLILVFMLPGCYIGLPVSHAVDPVISEDAQDKNDVNKPADIPVSSVSFIDGVIDLTNGWYFSAYRPLNARADELDKISSITPDVYKKWNMVQAGSGWWTEDFDVSLNGNPYFEGYAWYVCTFISDNNIPQGVLKFVAGSFDEANEVYFNGQLIGSNGMEYNNEGIGIYDGSNPWEDECVYDLKSEIIEPDKVNTIAVRMCNSNGGGGWYKGPVGIYTEDAFNKLKKDRRLVEKTYISASTGNTEQTYRIYLPEGYNESSESYPVLYFLHGYGSTSRSYEIDGIDKLLDEAIENGEMAPMIVVFPDDPTKESFWLEQYGDMVGKDLVQEIDSNYRTIADAGHRLIGGCSMGGGGAFHIGTAFPDTFSGIISFYGALSIVDANKSVKALSDEQLQNIKIWMACGDKDMYGFYEDQEEMSKLLEKRGITHYSEISEGEHNSEFYMPRLIQSIKYIQEGMQ